MDSRRNHLALLPTVRTLNPENSTVLVVKPNSKAEWVSSQPVISISNSTSLTPTLLGPSAGVLLLQVLAWHCLCGSCCCCYRSGATLPLLLQPAAILSGG